MIVGSIKARNFRSFEGIADNRIIFRKGINIIVGENNVGKSSLLRALKIASGQIKHEQSDIFKMEGIRELIIEIEIRLDNKEMRDLLSYITGNSKHLLDSNNLNRFVKDLGDQFVIKYSSSKGFSFKTSTLRFQGANAYLIKNFSRHNTQTTPFDVFFKYYLKNNNLSITQFLNEKDNQSPKKAEIRFDGQPISFTQKLLKEKLKVISEIRKRPYGPNTRVNESLDGGEVASVLFTLKNGEKKDAQKFKKIQEDFNDLFQDLSLDVRWGAKNMPLIFIENISIANQVQIENVGAGIGEMIILLTLLTESKGLIIGLDLPEMQFHPHAQRLLLKVLEKHSLNNQIIVVTHSPMLLNPNKLDNVTIIREQNGRSFRSQLPPNYFNNTEKVKVDRYLINNIKDLFFSRATLLVEGPTEVGAMPVFADKLGFNFDSLGVSIVEMGGKHFGIWDKLLSGFGIPHIVMTDKDALLHIAKGKIDCNNSKIKTSAVLCNLSKANHLTNDERQRISEVQNQILNGGAGETYPNQLFGELKKIAEAHNVCVLVSDFEGILKQEGYSDLLQNASSISGSKPSQGRFVAEEIVNKNKKIPEEFVMVITKIKELASPSKK